MKVKDYGFIVKGAGFNPEKHRSVLNSPQFKTTVVGVERVEEAYQVAKEMAEGGVQVIELCGAFQSENAEKLMQALGNTIPVGVVQFNEKALKLL